MELLDTGTSGGGGSESLPDSNDDNEDSTNDYTVSTYSGTTTAGDDTPSISLGDSDPIGPQQFDGTAEAEQPDTPSTTGETIISGGTNTERQEARDIVFENESIRQQEENIRDMIPDTNANVEEMTESLSDSLPLTLVSIVGGIATLLAVMAALLGSD